MALSAGRPSRSKLDENKAAAIEILTDTAVKQKRLNAQVEDELYKRIKMKAVEEGESISEITRRLWLEYLSK